MAEKKIEWRPYPRFGGRMEWLCPHGVGHGNHVHGCDGCCSKRSFPPRAWDEYIYMPCLQTEEYLQVNDDTSNNPSRLWRSPDDSNIIGILGSIGLVVENGEPVEASNELFEALKTVIKKRGC